MHGGNHFTHDGRAGFEAEFFAETNANGGGNLSHDERIGIVNGGHDFVIVAVADDSTGRANGGALTAVDAIDFAERQPHGGLNDGVKSTFCEIENADALNFGAGFVMNL